ncbi:acyltransferase [Nocardioides sp. BGMRC 2183]|nr:acyltransferase [Nocardioides sp. BGMRC 2183]
MPMSWGYRPELDGLRALAVITIVFFHAGVAGWANSFVALDLFFVLSGFLVSNVVLAEIDASGRFRLGRFYARRVRRLLPAAVVAIIATSVMAVLVVSEPERIAFVRQAQAALLYVANWEFIAEQGDYFAGAMRESPFMHYWSLSIEEQFYILFPLLVLGIHRLFPGRLRALLIAFSAIAALSVVSQLYWGQVDPGRAYYATDARAFELMAGAIAAVALRQVAARRAAARQADEIDAPTSTRLGGLSLAAVATLGCYVVLGTSAFSMTASHRNLVAAVIGTALVLLVYLAQGSLVSRALSVRPMVYLGKISYGTYLWHWPVIFALQHVLTARPLVIAVLAGTLATAMASLSYELLETPIRRNKLLDGFEWRAVGAGVSVSALVAVFAIAPVLTSPRTPVVAAAGQVDIGAPTEVTEELDRPVPDIDFEAVSKDRGAAGGRCTPEDLESCRRVEGSGPHVVLVGDSQARAMVPAFTKLAEERDWTLSTSVVMACPWQQGLYSTEPGENVCRDARKDFYDKTLPAMEPDVVVFVNLARSAEAWEGVLVDERGRSKNRHKLQLDATKRTVDLVEKAGARSLIVHSMLGTNGWDRDGWDPLDCLARAKTQRDCVVNPPLDRPEVDGYYDTLETERDSVATVDVNPAICPDAPYCRPILRDAVVWRDGNHVTPTVVKRVRKQIGGLIDETGVLRK